MPEARGSSRHRQALTAMGSFTGLARTALILLLGSPAPFPAETGPRSSQPYFETLTTYIAGAGALSGVAMLGYLEVAGGMPPTFRVVDPLGTTRFLLAVSGSMGTLPLPLVAFTRWGALAVPLLAIVLLGFYLVGHRVIPTPVGAPGG